jgi:hypothetical protein
MVGLLFMVASAAHEGNPSAPTGEYINIPGEIHPEKRIAGGVFFSW